MVMSPTPYFIVQMTEKLTTWRYTFATIYVYMVSKFGYLVLQRTDPQQKHSAENKSLKIFHAVSKSK